MTDLEMTKLCAKAMGRRLCTSMIELHEAFKTGPAQMFDTYDPFHNDVQVMELVKKLNISLAYEPDAVRWQAYLATRADTTRANKDLNRAIVECAAAAQAAKVAA